MGNGEFKAQGGISALLENFDFDAKCEVVGFEVTYLPKRQDPIAATNGGARWSGEVADMIQQSQTRRCLLLRRYQMQMPGRRGCA